LFLADKTHYEWRVAGFGDVCYWQVM